MIAPWVIIVGGLLIGMGICIFFALDITYYIRCFFSFLWFLITLPFGLLHVLYCHWKRK